MTDPLGRFASTALTDYPRAVSDRHVASWLETWLRDQPDERLRRIVEDTYKVVREAARRELTRRAGQDAAS